MNTEKKVENEMSEESLRRRALAEYVSLPVARLVTVAKRLNLPKELIQKWHSEDSWLAARAQFQKDQHQNLTQRFGDSGIAAERALEFSNLIDARIRSSLARGTVKGPELEALSRTNANVFRLRNFIYEELGL